MQVGEHIATYFEPPSMQSPLAGIGPADLHNRDPRQLPLVVNGAAIVGNGVLAAGTDHQVVFAQFPPYLIGKEGQEVEDGSGILSFGEKLHLKRTYRRACFTLTRILGNMGVCPTTPLLARIASPAIDDESEPPSARGRWSQGLYLDQPEEWDDPYRFFRW